MNDDFLNQLHTDPAVPVRVTDPVVRVRRRQRRVAAVVQVAAPPSRADTGRCRIDVEASLWTPYIPKSLYRQKGADCPSCPEVSGQFTPSLPSEIRHTDPAVPVRGTDPEVRARRRQRRAAAAAQGAAPPSRADTGRCRTDVEASLNARTTASAV